jgi:glyoxylase-like metal-dependent hydrolase (beta-lactamase superfamily II)
MGSLSRLRDTDTSGMAHPSRPERARADKIVPGIWRLRLPLPWDATPHGNAYAVSAGDGIVLFDTGYGGSNGLPQLELGLRLAGFSLEDVRLVVCTHTHSDHYGCAASIVERTGAPLWLHPAWAHVKPMATDFDAAVDARLELARRNGFPEGLLEEMERARRGSESGFDGAPGPDRELMAGVEVETDLGTWVTHETPGHAPSHVVLHQPDRQILISGDMIVGRVFLFFDAGHTPDPVGEFLTSLDLVEGLDTGLVLSGHGKPFRDAPAKVAANRAEVERQLGAVRDALAGEPKTIHDLIRLTLGREPSGPIAGYLMEMTIAYLTHLEMSREATRVAADPERWELL